MPSMCRSPQRSDQTRWSASRYGVPVVPWKCERKFPRKVAPIVLSSGMSPIAAKDEPVVEGKSSNEREELTGRALRLRIRQQELLAELGVLALQRTSFTDLLNHTARMTAEGLDAEYCKIMEYIAADKRLLVRAGVGWGEGVVGTQLSAPIWIRRLATRSIPASR